MIKNKNKKQTNYSILLENECSLANFVGHTRPREEVQGKDLILSKMETADVERESKRIGNGERGGGGG